MSKSPSESFDRLELALKASNEGVWDWDIETDEIFYSNRVLGFLGHGQVGAPNIFSNLGAHVHPDDLANFRRKLDRIFHRNGRLLAIEPRIRTADRSWKWFRVRAIPIRDDEGKVIRLVGSMIDISKRKNAEAELAEEQGRIHLLFENISVNVYFKDRDSRFVRVNHSTAERMGLSSVEDLVGKTDHDFFGKEHADAARQDELQIMETGQGLQEKLEHETWDDGRDTWVLTTKNVWRGPDGEIRGTFGVTNDVTDLIKARERLEIVTQQLSSVNRDIEAERHLLRLVIDNIPLYVYFKDQDSNFVLVNQWMVDLFGVENVEDVVGKHDRDFFGHQHGEVSAKDEALIMESGESIIGRLERIEWDEGRVTWSLTSKLPWYDQKGEISGTFGVSADVTKLVEIRNQLADVTSALAQKNKAIEEELKLAREVQQAAIPETLPTFHSDKFSVHFFHRYEPASDLAGDFFEVIPLGTDRAGFLVCDVMGHGVRAALIVAMLRGLIEQERELAGQPGEFLRGLNDGLSHLLDRTNLTMFATAVYGAVDLPAGEVRLALAGHPEPLRRSGASLDFPSTKKGPALGLMEGVKYGEVSLPLADLNGLLCFTDGILEAEDSEGQHFGRERLAETLNKATDLRLGMDRALSAARDFSVSGRCEDDVCLLGLEVSNRSQ